MQAIDEEITVTGKLFKIARIEEEWYEDVEDPASFITSIKKAKIKADIFTFWQRLPDIEPKYNYYMEWDSIAALPIKSFDYWWKKQINAKTRNVARKAEKKGVVVKIADFNDELVKGITNVFNESPIRQGKPFWHYGKDFRSVKEEMSDRLDRAEFIGAYYNDDLIGFIKLLYTENYAMTSVIVSMIKHRDKSPTNALLAKAVDICDKKKILCLTYSKWIKGGLGDFKRHNGFEKIDLPRYYIPLTIKGMIILKLNLHHGITEILPEKLKDYLVNLRWKLYSKKYRNIKNV